MYQIDQNMRQEKKIEVRPEPDFYFTVDLDTQGTRIGLPLGEDELTDRVNEIIDKVLEQDLYNQWYEEYKEYAKKLGLEG